MDDLFAGVASSIRQAREQLGRSEDDVAREIGLGSAAYEDLEIYDDEVSTSISIGQLRRLAKALERPLGQLLSVAREHRGPEVSIDALLDRIRIELATRGESVEAFGERIGWDVSSALETPARAWDDWNLDMLRDVANAVSCDWIAILLS